MEHVESLSTIKRTKPQLYFDVEKLPYSQQSIYETFFFQIVTAITRVIQCIIPACLMYRKTVHAKP